MPWEFTQHQISPRQHAINFKRLGNVEDPTRRIRLTIHARLERDSRTESVEEYFRARSGTRDSNSYFFLSPLHSVNLIRVFWTSSRSRRILTEWGRGMPMLRTGQRSSLGPFLATEKRKRKEGSWMGDAARWYGMCRGWIFRNRKGDSGLILFRRGMIALAAWERASRFDLFCCTLLATPLPYVTL